MKIRNSFFRIFNFAITYDKNTEIMIMKNNLSLQRSVADTFMSSRFINTFVYLFSHKGSASYSELLLGGAENFYGTCHSDDLIYLFPLHKTIPKLFSSIPSKEDKEVTRLMTKLWVNFATTGWGTMLLTCS